MPQNLQPLSQRPSPFRAITAGARNRGGKRRITRPFKLPLPVAYSLLLLALLLPLLATNLRWEWANSIELLTFFMTGSIICPALYLEIKKRPFSIATMHWTFCLTFLFYTPLVQFLAQHPPAQTDVGNFDDFLVQSNFIVGLWASTFLLVSYLVKPSKIAATLTGTRRFHGQDLAFVSHPFTLLYLVLASSVSIGVVFAILGFYGAILRGGGTDTTDQPLALIAAIFFRVIGVVAALLIATSSIKNGWLKWPAFFLCAIPAFLINSPIAVARFWFAALLLGVLSVSLRKKRISAFWMTAAVVASLIFVLPILSAGRYATDLESLAVDSSRFENIGETFSHGDFDAYSMIGNTVAFVEKQGVQGPEQLVGNLLFFVPRSLWPDKPLGSGQTVALFFHMPNPNLSQPLPSEGYINFGLIGVVAFAAVAAFLVRYLDNLYWACLEARVRQPLNMVYPFLPGLFFFIMRGDLLSSVAFTTGFAFAFFLTIRSVLIFEGAIKTLIR